ncbi:MAG: hypothetical protein Rubg2KO_11250 [Rubricoccaceae bacterium]
MMTRWSVPLVALAMSCLTSSNAQPTPAWTPLNAGSQSLPLPVASDMDAVGNVVVIQFPPGAAFESELARWDGTQWTVLSRGLRVNATGMAVTDAGDAVYVSFRSGGTVTNGNGATVAVDEVARYHIPTATWDDLSGGLNANVFALDTDGAGNLIVGGPFTQANDGTSLSHVARWNQSTGAWEPLGGGVSGNALALAVEPGGTVAVAGDFDQTLGAGGGSAGGVARFDFATGQWQALGSGFDAGGRSFRGLVSNGVTVTVTGTTLRAGGVAAPVYQWNGASWAPYANIGDVAVNPAAIMRDGAGTTYVLGTTSGNVFRNGHTIHARGPSAPSWTLVAHAPTTTSSFRTMAANASRSGDALFLGGPFTSFEGLNASQVAATNFAHWDGVTWTGQQPPFVGISGTVYAAQEVIELGPLVPNVPRVAQRRMAVGGNLTDVAGVPVNRIAVYDGVAWDDPGQGVTDPQGVVRAILGPEEAASVDLNRTTPPDAPFIIGGTFDEVTDENGTAVPVSNLAEWQFDTSSWRSLGRGVSQGGVPGTGVVYALAYYPGCVRESGTEEPIVYVGGTFDTATNADGSTVAVSNVARYNLVTHRWETIEGGANGTVHALDVVPYWDQTSQVALDQLAGHSLYVGGRFSAALDDQGAQVADTQNLAWISADGAWRGMGGGTNGPVFALDAVEGFVWRSRSFRNCGETFETTVYVGGAFQSVISDGPQVPASNLAMATVFSFDPYPTTWEELGLPFGQASGTPGNGVNGTVHSLDVIGPLTSTGRSRVETVTLIAGGSFTEAYDSYGRTVPAPSVAQIRAIGPGTTGRPVTVFEYAALGGGTNGLVESTGWTTCPQPTGQTSSAFYVGGVFGTVGGSIASPGLAKWRDFLPPPPVRVTHVAGRSGPRRSCNDPNVNCAVGAAATPAWVFQCRAPSLGRFASSTRNDAIELGAADFGETAVTTAAGLSPDVPLAIEIRDTDGTLIGADTVAVQTLGAVAFVVTGVDAPDQFVANPTGRAIGLAVTPVQMPARPSDDAPETPGWVRLLHAVTDAPALDVRLTDGTVLADSVVFDSLSVPVAVPLGVSSLEVRRTDDNSLLSTLQLDVASDDPTQLLVLAGFVDPAANQNGPPLQLVQVSMDESVPVASDDAPVESGFALHTAAPNPATHTTALRFQVPHAETVTVTVFDALGRHVATLHDAPTDAGEHVAVWDANGLASGVYLVQMLAGVFSEVQTVTVVR